MNRPTGTTTSSSQNKRPRLSPVICPEGMDIVEWQKALRRQAAETEGIKVLPPGPSDRDGYFTAISRRTGEHYHVVHRGQYSKWNYCSCPDFRTNGLGTCKHIEAINIAADGRYARRMPRESSRTSVFVDYRGERKVRIHFGSETREEMMRLAAPYFTPEGELREESVDSFGTFLEQARQLEPEMRCFDDALDYVLDRRQSLLRQEILRSRPHIASDALRTALYPYQEEGARFAFRQGRVIIADEMGLGKTVQSLAAAEMMRREGIINSVLVICPTSLKYQWAAEIERFTDSTASVVEGNPAARRDLLAADDFYKVASYHSIANDIHYGSVPRHDLIIYDEVQRLKNWDTKMARAMRRLKSDYVFALSGTPLENRLMELYSVMQLVDQYALGPLWQFNHITTQLDGTGRVAGYKNLSWVADKMKDSIIRRRKAEVEVQMPERTDQYIFVPLTDEQRALHEEYSWHLGILISRWKRQGFLPEKDRKRLLLFLSMMRMVCDSTFVLDQQTRHDTKIAEAINIINAAREEGAKVVVFSQWERMLRALAKDLTEAGTDFRFLHGGVPSAKRKELIESFANDDSCGVFLSTDAGSTGLNLQSASIVINLDLPWNPAVLEQRIARAYRIGQQRHVQIINMVAKDSIEERIISTLQLKSALFAGVLDGGADSVILDHNKFDRIATLLSDVIPEPTDTPPVHRERAEVVEPEQVDSPALPGEDVPGFPMDDAGEAPIKETPAVPEEDITERPHSLAGTAREPLPPADLFPHEDEGHDETSSAPYKAEEYLHESPGELVAASVQALSRLATALADPDSRRKIVDSIVKEDPATGHPVLSIPVPDKTSVDNILTLFASLLSPSR